MGILILFIKNRRKNNDNFDAMFNGIIENLDLREIASSGQQFTWASSLATPNYEKLDRVLVSVKWEQKYPLGMVCAL